MGRQVRSYEVIPASVLASNFGHRMGFVYGMEIGEAWIFITGLCAAVFFAKYEIKLSNAILGAWNFLNRLSFIPNRRYVFSFTLKLHFDSKHVQRNFVKLNSYALLA